MIDRTELRKLASEQAVLLEKDRVTFGCGVVLALLDELDTAEREHDEATRNVTAAHRLLDAAGIPAAAGVRCEDPECQSHLYHRTRDIIERRDAAREALATVTAERDELAATLANERGEGDPPCEGHGAAARAEHGFGLVYRIGGDGWWPETAMGGFAFWRFY